MLQISPRETVVRYKISDDEEKRSLRSKITNCKLDCHTIFCRELESRYLRHDMYIVDLADSFQMSRRCRRCRSVGSSDAEMPRRGKGRSSRTCDARRRRRQVQSSPQKERLSRSEPVCEPGSAPQAMEFNLDSRAHLVLLLPAGRRARSIHERVRLPPLTVRELPG